MVNNKADNAVVTVFLRLHSFTDESTIGLLHSSIKERNVGKLLTLDLSAKGQGIPTHKHNIKISYKMYDFRLMTKLLEKDEATKLKTQETFCKGNGKSV